MNIIEKRRRKAWAHATMVIMNKVIREASTGTIFIYGETLYGKDYFLTPDDALDAVLVTMGVLRKLWERDGVRTLIKSGPVYDVWHFDCCDREYAENKTDAGATELPLNVCPFCGTSVMGEGRDAVHG